jgi:Ca-activated chloride channel family protein
MGFSFAKPGYLFLLLLVPLLLAWWSRRRRPALRHPTALQIAVTFSRRAAWARRGGLLLRGLALMLMALALAGPRWPDLRTRIHTEGVALMMLLDVSGSMGKADFSTGSGSGPDEKISRLEAVQRVFRLFVQGGEADGKRFEGRPTDLIGLVTFGTRPEKTPAPTLSHSALLRLIDEQHALTDPDRSWTNLSDALVEGLERLRACPAKRKVLVLLTDGAHNVQQTASRWLPRETALIAASLDVPIYVIDAGSDSLDAEEGGPRPVGENVNAATERRNEAVWTMQELARISQGRYFTASDTSALVDACKAIDRLERVPIESFQYRRYHEAYPWLALAAFVTLALVLALEMTVWRRIP